MSGQLALTRHRAAVLEAIQQTHKHLTAQEIYDLVRQRLPSIAYGTVYNSLAYLRDAGLVQELNTGAGPALYDSRTDRHDHLVCRACGQVTDYHWSDLDRALIAMARETQFRIERAHIVFEGVCVACQRQNERPTPIRARS